MYLKDLDLDKLLNWNKSIYDQFFTDVSVKNQPTRELVLLLLDLGCNIDVDECMELKQKLLEYCPILAAEESSSGLSDEELIGQVELKWTKKLLEIISNLQKPDLTSDVNDRLKYLLGEFNLHHDFKVSN